MRIMNDPISPFDDSQPTVLVLLDDRGALVDLLPCGQLSGNIPKSGKSFMDVFSDERKRKDVGRIKDKILDKVGRSVGGQGGLFGEMQIQALHLSDFHPAYAPIISTLWMPLVAAPCYPGRHWQPQHHAAPRRPPSHLRLHR